VVYPRWERVPVIPEFYYRFPEEETERPAPSLMDGRRAFSARALPIFYARGAYRLTNGPPLDIMVG